MLRVRDVMTVYPMTVCISQAALGVREGMKLAHIRHIPVVDDENCLVGIISQSDLLRAMVYAVSRSEAPMEQHPLGSLAIHEVMTRDVKVVFPDEPLRTAVGSLISERIGCLPVVERGAPGKLIGIITETDMLHILERLLDRDEPAPAAPDPQPDPGTP